MRDSRATYQEAAVFHQGGAFEYGQTTVFCPTLCTPATRFVRALAQRVTILQRGPMNAYLAYIGVLLLLVLGSVFWR